MFAIDILKTVKDMQARSEQIRLQGKTIAFVPTMGFLHEGHLSLLKQGRKKADYLVLSIFVNPTQFGPNEDLDSYPQDIEKDLGMAKELNVDAVFLPTREELYGPKFQTYVTLEKLPAHLCGISRPVHFRGVATVVSKLFNIVKPHISIFGQKDFQQLAVIKQMVKDLNFDIEIIGAPTIREEDGLAMSSRNSYLNKEQRQSGLSLYKAIQKAKQLIDNGERDSSKIIKETSDLILSHPDTKIDYVSICDPDSLDDMALIDRPALFVLAVFVGTTRLIDNYVLTF